MKFISYGTTRQIGRTVLVLKKNSPHLFFAGGLLGSITSTILACRATLKLEPTVDAIKEDIKAVKIRKDNRSYLPDLGMFSVVNSSQNDIFEVIWRR